LYNIKQQHSCRANCKLVFGLTAIINKSLKPDMRSLVWGWLIETAINFIWRIAYMLTITIMATVRIFLVISLKL